MSQNQGTGYYNIYRQSGWVSEQVVYLSLFAVDIKKRLSQFIILSNFAYCYGLKFLRQCCLALGIFPSGFAKLYSSQIGFSRQIVTDDIFSQR